MTTPLTNFQIPDGRLGRSPCQIWVADGALSRLPAMLPDLGRYESCFVLYDPAVLGLAQQIAADLSSGHRGSEHLGSGHVGTVHLLAVAGGEAAKILGRVESLALQMQQKNANRASLVVNVGGGVITDLGGFLASIYMRGIDFVHVPTTLLGMCDAAVGGKTGVDLQAVKNILGSFQQPRAVVVDPKVLGTLPMAQMREGLVEVIKKAAMLDKEVFAWLQAQHAAILQGEEKAVLQCVQHAVRMKVAVVCADALEADQRMLLNFGHTVGHALETLSQFSISHGTAVSMGMICEMRACGSQGVAELVDLLQAIGMPTEMPSEYGAEALWQVMLQDKKNVGGKVRIAIAHSLGEGKVMELGKDAFLAVMA